MAISEIRWRYRRGLFGRLILQIEEITNHCVPAGNGLEDYQVKRWRDARLADISAVETPA